MDTVRSANKAIFLGTCFSLFWTIDGSLWRYERKSPNVLHCSPLQCPLLLHCNYCWNTQKGVFSDSESLLFHNFYNENYETNCLACESYVCSPSISNYCTRQRVHASPGCGEDPHANVFGNYAYRSHNSCELGGKTIDCYDLLTGEKLWEKPTGVTVNGGSRLLLAGGKLIASAYNSCGDFDLFALDAETSEETWHKPKAFDGNKTKLATDDGVLYFLSDRLKITALDIATGEELWQAPTPNITTCMASGYPTNEPKFSSGIAINPELGYIYASDSYFALCIKLPEH